MSDKKGLRGVKKKSWNSKAGMGEASKGRHPPSRGSAPRAHLLSKNKH